MRRHVEVVAIVGEQDFLLGGNDRSDLSVLEEGRYQWVMPIGLNSWLDW
jgi:hypothetical protein